MRPSDAKSKDTQFGCKLPQRMKPYDPKLESFVDHVNFGPKDPCTWIVYPAGCAGDLLASVVNFHYIETGAKFMGLKPNGQVMFRSSDMKIPMHKKNIEFDDKFFFGIADALASRHLNWSLMDNFIFANHYYQDHQIRHILNTFVNCKIIRLLPKTVYEKAIIDWLADFKNKSVTQTFELPALANEIIPWSDIVDARVLTVFFGDFVNVDKFSSMYQAIQQHLDFAGPMITYDFVKFWIDNQSLIIRDHIIKASSREF